VTLASVAALTTDGSGLFQNLDLTFGAERTGIVGANGVGKSTLLGLIEGRLQPSEGTVSTRGHIWSLRQQVAPAKGTSLPDLLGVGPEWSIIQRVLDGSASEEDLDLADWTLEMRVGQALSEVGLDQLGLGSNPEHLSGGERTRVALAGLLLSAPDIVLLDEPTNHLDQQGRAMVANLLRQWESCMLVVSHDRDLLMQVDRIVELSASGARIYGGNYELYQDIRLAEREAAHAQLAHARKALDQAAALAQTNREKRERRDSAGKRAGDKGGMPKILLGARKSAAQQSTGKQLAVSQKLIEERQNDLEVAERSVERVRAAEFEITPTGLSAGREIASANQATVCLDGQSLLAPVSFHWQGPVRVAVTGPNGAGKTTLLRLLSGGVSVSGGEFKVTTAPVLLDQNVSLLRDDETVRDAWMRLNPQGTVQQAQAALARFLFRNTAALRVVGTLSGGERLRAALACVLGGVQPARFLLLDEPTNHLDLPSIEAVETALSDYDGALVVVSHDRQFLEAIGIEEFVGLGPV